jgi:hypothetical protein
MISSGTVQLRELGRHVVEGGRRDCTPSSVFIEPSAECS